MANRGDEIIRYVFETSGSKELEAAARALLATGDASEQTEENLRGLAEEFGRLSKQSSALKSLIGQKAALTEVSAKLAEAKSGLAALNAEFSASDRSSRAVSQAFSAAERSVARLSAEEARLSVAFAKSEGVLAAAGIDTAKLAEAQAELARRSSDASARIADLSKQAQSGGRLAAALKSATDTGARGFQALREGVNEAAQSLLRITGIAGAVTTALGALSIGRLFGGAASSARELSSVLSEVRAVSGATAEEMQQLRASAESVAASTKFSTADAARGLGELARATGSAQAAMAALPATMQLAQAAGYGVADSATLITTTLTQFGLSAENAGRVADVLAKAANATTADIQGLGNSLSYAAPLAKQLGLSFEQTTAIIGALADQGFRGERAGTALRNVFSELLNPTSEFRQALLSLGITSNDFSSIIEGLAKAGDRGRDALMSLDAQARPAILSLVSSGGAAIRGLKADLDNAAGSAASTAKTMGANLDGAWSRMLNALDSLRRALIDPILDPLVVQFDEAANRIRGFLQTADFERITTSLRGFANSAISSIRELASSIDFSSLTTSIQDFVRSAGEWFKSLRDNATAAGTALSIVGNSVSIFWNLLQTTILTAAGVAASAFAGLVKAAEIAARGMAALSGTSAAVGPALDSLSEKIGGLLAVADEFGRRAKANGKETEVAFQRLAGVLTATGDAARKATPAIERLGQRSKLTAEQATELRRQYEALPEWLQKIVQPALRASGALDQAAEGTTRVADAAQSTADSLASAEQRLRDAVSGYSRLAASGGATADQLSRSGAAVAGAAMALDKLQASASGAAKGSEALKTAFATLGISSQRSLLQAASSAEAAFNQIQKAAQVGAASQEDVRASFARYAEAQLAAVANSESWKQQTVRDMLEVKRAALGLSETLSETTQTTPAIKPPDTTAFRAGIGEAVKVSGDATDQMLKDQKRAEEAQKQTTGALGGALEALAQNMTRFAAVSESAALEYNRLVEALYKGAAAFSMQAAADGTGIIRYGEAVAMAAKMTEEAIQQQRESVASLVSSWGKLSEEQIAQMAISMGGIEKVSESLRAQAQAAREGHSQLELLGSADLAPLAAALDGAAAKVEQLRERTEAAKQSFEEYAASAREQIAQLNGDLDGAEQLRFERELERLKAQAEATSSLQSQEYQEAVKAATQLHGIKMAQIRKEAEERKRADEEAAAREAQQKAASSRGGAGGDGGDAGKSGGGLKTGADGKLEITLNGKDFGGVNPNDAAAIERLAKSMLPEIMRQLQRAASLTGRRV